MKTFSATVDTVEKKWFVIDATDLILGRMSALVANVLRGKGKTYFTPNVDCGDYVVIINAEKIGLTGNKEFKRKYWHTGYMGGVKFRTMKQLREDKPEIIIKDAVRRMISRGPLGRAIIKKLFVYAGNEHPHGGQKPELLDIKAMNVKNSKRN